MDVVGQPHKLCGSRAAGLATCDRVASRGRDAGRTPALWLYLREDDLTTAYVEISQRAGSDDSRVCGAQALPQG